jgi:sugar phosphate isomerase/epimerase
MSHTNSSADAFVDAARRFRAFIESTTTSGRQFVSELELVLADLYRYAIRLPSVDAADCDETPPEIETALDVRRLADRLGANRYYWMVFNPASHDDHEPVCADLLDDLEEILSEIEEGLLWFDLGSEASRSEAMWHLKFGFEQHWGAHAINALTALHSLLRRT